MKKWIFNSVIYIIISVNSSSSFLKNKNEYEEFCKEITGWSKLQFTQFSEYITSINETNARSKNELIAIYLYWIRKGIDQFSLSLFKHETTQRDISRYLDQIRAIYKDFVPYFLGSKNGRSFFLKHNTIASKKLYNLENDNLCIVVDGTYTRLEKSFNNKFQYNTWSQQKKDNLIKPFLITCADGYIIDCYGPFQANLNDAFILACLNS